MLNDWLVDYIKSIVEEYDLSFSEVVRLALCLEFIKLVAKRFPSYKPKVSDNDLLQFITEFESGNYSREKFHSFISKVYFEARKAAELRMNSAAKRKNNP